MEAINRYDRKVRIGALNLVVNIEQLERAKKEASFRKVRDWAHYAYQPQGFLTITMLYPMQAERSHKLVRRLFSLIGRRYGGHILWEAWYGRHPNGHIKNKVHYHIFYRCLEVEISRKIYEAYWIALQKKRNGTASEIHKAADGILRKLGDRKSDKQLAQNQEYTYQYDMTAVGLGRQHTYAHEGHKDSIGGMTCPRKAKPCRSDKCKHRKGGL